MAGRRHEATENRLLAAMTPADRKGLVDVSRYVELEVKTVLFEPGKPVEGVYFPLDGVISLVTPLEDGSIVEVATVGNEGVVGVPLIAGGTLARAGHLPGARRRAVRSGGGVPRRAVAQHVAARSCTTGMFRPCSARSRRRRPATGCTPTRSASAAGC